MQNDNTRIQKKIDRVRSLPGGLLPEVEYILLGFISTQTKKPYFVSRSMLEVNPLETCPLGPRHGSSSCSPTKGTPPHRNILRTI